MTDDLGLKLIKKQSSSTLSDKMDVITWPLIWTSKPPDDERQRYWQPKDNGVAILVLRNAQTSALNDKLES